jgi:hypothetical protein
MSAPQEISMLRITDDAGEQLIAACVSGDAADLLCIGQQDSWAEDCRPITSVIISVSGAIQITDPADVAAVSAWLGAAATWLRITMLESELSHEEDDEGQDEKEEDDE